MPRDYPKAQIGQGADRVSAPTLQRKPRWGGAKASHCVWGSSKPHVSQFAEKGVPRTDFGRILRAWSTFLRAPPISWRLWWPYTSST